MGDLKRPRAYVRILSPGWKKVLLVLNIEGPIPGNKDRDAGWSLPGGGIKPEDYLPNDEEELDAIRRGALREVREETGQVVTEVIKDSLEYVGEDVSEDKHTGDIRVAHVFQSILYTDDLPLPDCSHDPVNVVKVAKWWDLDEIMRYDSYKDVHFARFLYAEYEDKNGGIKEGKIRLYQAALRRLLLNPQNPSVRVLQDRLE